MALQGIDFQFYSGDSPTLNFTVKDEAGVLLDLGSSTIVWAAREYGKVNTNVAVLEYTTADNVTVTGTGTCSVEIDKTETVDMFGKYNHTLNVTDGSGDTFTPFPTENNGYGVFLVNKKIG